MTVAEKNSPESKAADQRSLQWLLPALVASFLLFIITLGFTQVLALGITVEQTRVKAGEAAAKADAYRSAAEFIVKQLAADREYRKCIEGRKNAYIDPEAKWFLGIMSVEEDARLHDEAWVHAHRLKYFRDRFPSVEQTLKSKCDDDDQGMAEAKRVLPGKHK